MVHDADLHLRLAWCCGATVQPVQCSLAKGIFLQPQHPFASPFPAILDPVAACSEPGVSDLRLCDTKGSATNMESTYAEAVTGVPMCSGSIIDISCSQATDL